MRSCEALWDRDRANRVHQLVTESLGHSCGDTDDNPCPFAPQKFAVVPLRPSERARQPERAIRSVLTALSLAMSLLLAVYSSSDDPTSTFQVIEFSEVAESSYA